MVNHRLFFILLILIKTVSFSQESTIKHYQKKCKVSNLILPCTNFNSNTFYISFPDSLYSNGSIEIKKLIIGKNKIKASLVFKKNRYTKAVYVIKKNKIHYLISMIDPLKFSVKKTKLGRKIKVEIICEGM